MDHIEASCAAYGFCIRRPSSFPSIHLSLQTPLEIVMLSILSGYPLSEAACFLPLGNAQTVPMFLHHVMLDVCVQSSQAFIHEIIT